MGSIARALAATSLVCLLATACDPAAPTDPELRTPQQPALDGIGMVGTGGRSAEDGTESGTTTDVGTDTTVVAAPLEVRAD